MTKVIKTNLAIAAIAMSRDARAFSDKLDASVADAMKAVPGEIVAAIMAYTIGELMSNLDSDGDEYAATLKQIAGLILDGTHHTQAALRKQGGRVQ